MVGRLWCAGCSKYVPIGLQRNYSKDKSISTEFHVGTSTGKKINGWKIKQGWETEKLFCFEIFHNIINKSLRILSADAPS